MRRVFILAAAIVFSLSYAIRSYAAKKPAHVIVVGFDGWGAYSVPKAEMPNLSELMERGAWTLKKRIVLPSSSSIN